MGWQAIDPVEAVERSLALVDAREPNLLALLPEPGRRARLLAQAEVARARAGRLGGLLVGVKDLFHVDGFETRAGSSLPPGTFHGPQASAVTRLLDAGALVLGKTTTDELAYSDPPPTRNPHDLSRTPGGSSAGSAVAVAAGYCPAALGTQTSRSIIAPAAFCGVFGMKPSFGRIPTHGIVPFAPSMDTVGVLARGPDEAEAVLATLIDGWRSPAERVPVLGVPVGQYLDSITDAGWREPFAQALTACRAAGHDVREVPMGWDGHLREVVSAASHLMHGELASQHGELFRRHPELFRERIRSGLELGATVGPDLLASARESAACLRRDVTEWMDAAGVDFLLSPSQPGPAPLLGTRTGWGDTTVPWSLAGLPCASLPWGDIEGLPVGLQLIGRHGADEELLLAARRLLQMAPRS